MVGQQRRPGESDSESDDGRDVLAVRRGRLGHLELNRPRAINALNASMVRGLQDALNQWRFDDGVGAVLLTGRGDRGLCSGGDIVSVWHHAKAGRRDPVQYWREEYTLDYDIATYRKPFVSVMDGIVLGGGVGVSAHAAHRIVTERSAIGMPEPGIGFAPDVGGTWLLSRAPGELGTHLALTGSSIGPGDARALGLADYFMPSERLAELTERLTDEAPETAIAAVAEPAPDAPLLDDRAWIDECYASDDAAEIVRRLTHHEHPAAREAGALIASNSPFAVVATLHAMRRARRAADLRESLVNDLRVSAHFLEIPDFLEGVRARLIDKDRRPTWSDDSVASVDATQIERLFRPVEEGDLEL